MQGDHRQSLKVAKQLVKHSPASARAHNALGSSYLALADLANAESSWRQALLLDSANIEVRRTPGCNVRRATPQAPCGTKRRSPAPEGPEAGSRAIPRTVAGA